MNTSERKFCVEFQGGKLVLHARTGENATLFLDRVVALVSDEALEKAVEQRFGGKCIVIPLPIDVEFADKQMIFKVYLEQPIKKEVWFLNKIQRDLADLLKRVHDGYRATST